ncbi:hypothetical protein FNF31_02953 [Cafeteria roenbergensis]|uniref:Transglutaminase-like domain-containing protein n=1 Tax=Cafeteria roenbergensis TaxID=33653 RepID=A0A5A8DG17_CAFRO|nr:hypothetical protein FNF31_02953 [Cafeteria roenbergensis]
MPCVLQFEADRFPLESGETADPMVLMLQVQSITGVSPEEQILLSKSWDGPTPFAKAASLTEAGSVLATPDASVIVLLRANRGARAVSDDPSGAGKPLLVAAPESAAPGIGGVSFQNEKARQAIIEAIRHVEEPKRAKSDQQASRLLNNCAHMRAYDDPAVIEKALTVVPVVDIWAEARANTLQERANAGLPSLSADSVGPAPELSPAAVRDALAGGASTRILFRDSLLDRVASFFKHKFFKWTNTLPCSACGGGTRGGMGTQPTPEERRGGAGITEIHTCNDPACGAQTRFPRLNNPLHLLDSRNGRCGEWANTFTAICFALGFDARHVHDSTDHVWTEVWSDGQARWLHVDSCEQAIDRPLMYEAGWGKKLQWIVAVGRDEVVDVTRRYTRKPAEVLGRREEVPEDFLEAVVAAASECQRKTARLPPVMTPRADYIARRGHAEACELEVCASTEGRSLKAGEQHGRISGSLAWRASRRELGQDVGADAGEGAGSAPLTGPAAAALASWQGRGGEPSGFAEADDAVGWTDAASAPGMAVRCATAIANSELVLAAAEDGKSCVWAPVAKLSKPGATQAAASEDAAAAGASPAEPTFKPTTSTVMAGPRSASLAAAAGLAASALAEGAPFPPEGSEILALASDPTPTSPAGIMVLAATSDGLVWAMQQAVAGRTKEGPAVAGRARGGWLALPAGQWRDAAPAAGAGAPSLCSMAVHPSGAVLLCTRSSEAPPLLSVFHGTASSMRAYFASSVPLTAASAATAEGAGAACSARPLAVLPLPVGSAAHIACTPSGGVVASGGSGPVFALRRPALQPTASLVEAGVSTDLWEAGGLREALSATGTPDLSLSGDAAGLALALGYRRSAVTLADGTAAAGLSVVAPAVQPSAHPLVAQLLLASPAAAPPAAAAASSGPGGVDAASAASAIASALEGKSSAWIGLCRLAQAPDFAAPTAMPLAVCRSGRSDGTKAALQAQRTAQEDGAATTPASPAAAASAVGITETSLASGERVVTVTLPANKVPHEPGLYGLRLFQDWRFRSSIASLGVVLIAPAPLSAGTVISAPAITTPAHADGSIVLPRPVHQGDLAVPIGPCSADAASPPPPPSASTPASSAAAAASAAASGDAPAGGSAPVAFGAGTATFAARLVPTSPAELEACATSASADASRSVVDLSAAGATGALQPLVGGFRLESSPAGTAQGDAPAAAMSATLASTHSPWVPLAPLRSPGALVALKTGLLCLPSDGAAAAATFAIHSSADAVLAVPAAHLGVDEAPAAAQPTPPMPSAAAGAAASSAAPAAQSLASTGPVSPAPTPKGDAASPSHGSLRGSAASASSAVAPSPATPAAAVPPAIRAKAFFLMRASGCGSASCDVPHCRGAGPRATAPHREIMREAVPLVQNKANAPCPRIVAKLQGK